MITKIKSKENGLVVNYYRPIHFKIEELVDKNTFDSVDVKEKLWFLFDSRILWTIDKIRDLYDSSMTVNNWNSGGSLSLRGYRPPESNISPNIKVDQHKLGRAIDFNISGVDPIVFVEDVLNNKDQFEFQFISGLEIAPTWVHCDTRNFDRKTNNDLPLTFKA
jgi:hypothetical protein